MFTTKYEEILEQIDRIDPVSYGRTRNFIDGDVSKLSPYISRGVISTKQVMKRTLDRGFDPDEIKKWLQELAWRDYWQLTWIEKGIEINNDLRRPQPDVENHRMPKVIVEANTGIKAIDDAIEEFYETGYLHNHVRMYIAAICCSIGGSYWKVPAQWMYYHLKDGDWASNALSWQWVAGSNSNKKYVANQNNINKYCYTDQKGTFLDVPYESFGSIEIPDILRDLTSPNQKTPLPESDELNINSDKPTLIYNFYNVDPTWKEGEDANRILLFEPSIFEKYPVSESSIQFALDLGENIPNLQTYVGEFDDLKNEFSLHEDDTYFKEHPLNNYSGNEEPRDWMFSVKGYYPSFFKFWNKAKKELKRPKDLFDGA
ncbi:MAG: FAD-binding domain-containing protein [Balneola sp.]